MRNSPQLSQVFSIAFHPFGRFSLRYTEVARGYMNKPLPQLPFSPAVDTFRKKRNSQARQVLMEDDYERGNEPISPLFAMRNKNLIRRTREFPDLPLRHISASKPTFTVSPGHYTGDTLRAYNPPSQNRGPRGAEQQEVTLGLDQGSVKTPTRASRSMTNRPRPNVDVIPEEHGKLEPSISHDLADCVRWGQGHSRCCNIAAAVPHCRNNDIKKRRDLPARLDRDSFCAFVVQLFRPTEDLPVTEVGGKFQVNLIAYPVLNILVSLKFMSHTKS